MVFFTRAVLCLFVLLHWFNTNSLGILGLVVVNYDGPIT